MIVFPNAKINLGLHVLRRREDGFHDIATVMIPVPWCDILEVVPARGPDDTLTVTGNRVDCPAEKNLVMKAVNALRAADIGMVPPVDIRLHKVIPDGAGLGGGSADAAFMLKAVNRLFDLGLGDDRLCELAAKVGSDCPFFIRNVPSLATGRGEKLSEIPGLAERLAGYRIVIVKPEAASMPTAKAYGLITPDDTRDNLRDLLDQPADTWKEHIVNDFERPVGQEVPGIHQIRETLYSHGATYASMTGSGTAVYAIFPDTCAVDSIRTIFPDCRIFIG